jgi:hypothetical protein
MELKTRAREYFREGNWFRDSKELHIFFTNMEIDELSREGLIEMTAKPDVWAWKGD